MCSSTEGIYLTLPPSKHTKEKARPNCYRRELLDTSAPRPINENVYSVNCSSLESLDILYQIASYMTWDATEQATEIKQRNRKSKTKMESEKQHTGPFIK